jgi:Domain of unknown function (DUF4388)
VIQEPSDKSISFKGQLKVVSPFELGQFMLLGRKTGALHLINGDERGVLYVCAGQIVAAVGPDLRGGQETAMKLLGWTEGYFEFSVEPVPPSDEIELGTESLLLETARLLDESGEEALQLAVSLETVDELSKTFAALSDPVAGSSGSSDQSPLTWLSGQQGRMLTHLKGYSLQGFDTDGNVTILDPSESPDPGRILSQNITSPPFNGWVTQGDCRYYLCWGATGYRLIHPRQRPQTRSHISDISSLNKLFESAPAIAVFGQPDSGRSLLTALLVTAQAAQGAYVLYVTGLPTHDLGDGGRIIHHVQPPGYRMSEAMEAIGRWQPDWVAVDMDPTPGLADFVRACRASGIPLVMTLHAPLRQWARDSIIQLIGTDTGWEFATPRMSGSDGALEIDCAA